MNNNITYLLQLYFFFELFTIQLTLFYTFSTKIIVIDRVSFQVSQGENEIFMQSGKRDFGIGTEVTVLLARFQRNAEIRST